MSIFSSTVDTSRKVFTGRQVTLAQVGHISLGSLQGNRTDEVYIEEEPDSALKAPAPNWLTRICYRNLDKVKCTLWILKFMLFGSALSFSILASGVELDVDAGLTEYMRTVIVSTSIVQEAFNIILFEFLSEYECTEDKLDYFQGQSIVALYLSLLSDILLLWLLIVFYSLQPIDFNYLFVLATFNVLSIILSGSMIIVKREYFYCILGNKPTNTLSDTDKDLLKKKIETNNCLLGLYLFMFICLAVSSLFLATAFTTD